MCRECIRPPLVDVNRAALVGPRSQVGTEATTPYLMRNRPCSCVALRDDGRSRCVVVRMANRKTAPSHSFPSSLQIDDDDGRGYVCPVVKLASRCALRESATRPTRNCIPHHENLQSHRISYASMTLRQSAPSAA
jgi:hypothetical protein